MSDGMLGGGGRFALTEVASARNIQSVYIQHCPWILRGSQLRRQRVLHRRVAANC
jgi:hypothetical protein